MMDNAGDAAHRLMRQAIAGDPTPSVDEIQQIVDQIVGAPFDPRMVRPAPSMRHLTFGSYSFTAEVPSLIYHLAKRIVIDEQWAPDTTPEQYLEDLRQAVQHPTARLVVFARRGGDLAATVAPVDAVVPLQRRGVRALQHLIVVYSVDRRMIVTGYHFSDESTVSIPREARWLK
jgi:hypothetical protein